MDFSEQTSLTLIITLFLLVVSDAEHQSTTPLPIPVYNEKTYVYLIMVPDKDLHRLYTHRLRQDDDDGPGPMSFAQTGMFLGQIISGVLNFDSRPVFAGSVGFVEDPTSQRNIGTFLGTIAPAMNLILREMYTRAQIAFGFATTMTTPVLAPVQPAFIYENKPLPQSNASVASGSNKINSTTLLVEDYYETNYTVQQHLAVPDPTTSWEHVLHQILRESTTTVEPLPFLNLRSTTKADDDYDEAGDLKAAFD